jgi:hypothetical protein
MITGRPFRHRRVAGQVLIGVPAACVENLTLVFR